MNDLIEALPVVIGAVVVFALAARRLSGPPAIGHLLSAVAQARRGEVAGRAITGSRRAVFRHGQGWGQVVMHRLGWWGRGVHACLTLPWPHPKATSRLVVDGPHPPQGQIVAERPDNFPPASFDVLEGTLGDAVGRLLEFHQSAGMKHATIECRDGVCFCDVFGRVSTVSDVVRWVDGLVRVCDELDLVCNPSIRFDGAARPRLTTVQGCPVCGEGVHPPAVRCRSCGTAHHEECWNYNGRCAVYGCNSRSAYQSN